MKTIQFNVFLKDNHIKKTDLPKPLVEKINLFWKLHDLLGSIQESDEQELLEQLERLDYEILGDIEEEYEDQLENNDRLEELKNDLVTFKKPIGRKIIKKRRSTERNTDLNIIDELVKMKRTKNIGKSELIEMGLKTKIGRSTIIGSYVLKRISLFFYRYDIIPLKKE